MNTNGQTPGPDREQVKREMTYYAAIYGHYDTSVAAQKAGDLTIIIFNTVAHGFVLAPNTTHRFLVMINSTAYFVTRLTSGSYQVEPDDGLEQHRQERVLREAVLDMALWYLTGEGAGYRPEQGQEAQDAAIHELLEGEEPDMERDGGLIVHPVVREEFPDIFLAPGNEGSAASIVSRQWSVSFGDGASCEIGLIGYHDDGMPELIVVDKEDEGLDEDEGDARPSGEPVLA